MQANLVDQRHPITREVVGQFVIEAVAVTYTIGTASGGAQRAGELIVRNPLTHAATGA